MNDETLKQQIEEILDYAEIFYNDSRWEERERLNPTYTELEGKIDRLVTEARMNELIDIGVEVDDRIAELQSQLNKETT